jgi:hypothetical protein
MLVLRPCPSRRRRSRHRSRSRCSSSGLSVLAQLGAVGPATWRRSQQLQSKPWAGLKRQALLEPACMRRAAAAGMAVAVAAAAAWAGASNDASRRWQRNAGSLLSPPLLVMKLRMC